CAQPLEVHGSHLCRQNIDILANYALDRWHRQRHIAFAPTVTAHREGGEPEHQVCAGDRFNSIASISRRKEQECHYKSMTLLPTSRPTQQKAASASMTGSAIPGLCCSRILKTSRRCAPLSSATWLGSSPSSTNATPRSLDSASTRRKTTANGRTTS